MNKDFTTIATNIGNRVQDTTSTFATIIKTFVNKRYFQILRAINWNNIRFDYTFTTVDGTQDYVLPDDFGKEISVRDSTNGLELGRYDYQQLVTDYPDSVTDEGSVARYIISEDTVKEQPSAASVLAIVSSSAADTTQTILVRGVSGGVETSESVTLTGVTPVNTTNQYTRVKAISKSAITTGSVTVTSNTAAKTQTVMAPKVTESRFKKITLHYVPSTAIVIAVPYIIKPLPMTENNDYPVIDIADLIEIGAEADAWRYKRQDAKANARETMFGIELQQYIYDQENQPNQVVQFRPTCYDKDNLY